LVREDSLCQGGDISTVCDSAQGKACRKDCDGCDDTFNQIFSLIFEVIYPSEGESRYRFFWALVSTINSAGVAEEERGREIATLIMAAATIGAAAETSV
jgi:hypothetical protein